MARWRFWLGIIISMAILAIAVYPPVRQIISLQENQSLVVGEEQLITGLPMTRWPNMQVRVNAMSNQSEPAVVVQPGRQGITIRALNPGSASVQLSAFGYIPIKKINVVTAPRRRVVIGGQSVGIILQSRGIMVVGFANINNAGNLVSPAKLAGLEPGDVINQVNGQKVKNENELAILIDQLGRQQKPITLTIKRQGSSRDILINPVYCPETARYRIGLYVRDGVAGVGTMSFVDPETGNYAALGHVILDADTRQQIEVGNGQLVEALVQSVQPGRPGRPGEKIGIFKMGSSLTGDVKSNTFFGVYGHLSRGIVNPLYPQPVEVAYGHQVQTGAAQILTVLGGDEIQQFDVVIEKVYPYRHTGKSMVIKIVDPRLLAVTGGIVQGMSGSPIIQNSRIIGAVTHVFLHDPQRGYGVFMDNMLNEINQVKLNSINYQKLSKSVAA
ncbi:MAG: SpoIVB peptidase [Methylocystaceae bacterium]